MQVHLDLVLTDEDVAAIAHFCEDPELWVRETFARSVDSAILERINSFRPKYLQAKESLGEKYLNRAQRKLKDEADLLAGQELAEKASKDAAAEFQRKVDEAVARALAR